MVRQVLVMGINWANLTFSSLGFEGIKNLSNMTFNLAKGRYETMDFPRAKSVHGELLLPKLIDHLVHHTPKGYVAALAYMLDGSIEYAQRGVGGKKGVNSGIYGKDFYKTCQYINANSNIECVDSLILTHQPEGLFLLQEIPCDNRKMRRFRIVHESFRDDRLDEKERKALLAIRKKAIVKSCRDYLRDLGGPEGLSESEIMEVVAVLDVMKALDPREMSGFTKRRANRKKKTDGNKILKFRDNADQNKDSDGI